MSPLPGAAAARHSRTRVTLILLALATAIAFVGSLLIGPAAIGFGQVIKGLFGGQADIIAIIVQEVRLPRALLGLLVGATLGLAGAAMQGFLRNPLAEPGIIGVSASAALGAVIALYYGLSAVFALSLPLGGMIGALLAVAILESLAGREASPFTLILAGIAISSLAGALTALALNLAPSPFAAIEIVFWMLGSLRDRSMTHVWLVLPFVAVGWTLLFSLRRPLDALTLGDEAAQSLGFNMNNVRRRLILGTALAVGAAVSVSGVIGFVGLVVPHLLRPLVGHRPGALLLASALGGAALTLTADILVRVVLPTRDLKLGVVTAVIGAPFFFWLVIKSRGGRT
ncbi:MAG: iron ABC transporter permease [Alphaproteobacteria bacterium]|nr:iron ABC transporter permease [Alphaproteobacteria bacterium]